MKKPTSIMSKNIETKLRARIRGLVESILKEENHQIHKIATMLNGQCEKATDSLGPSEQAQVYTYVAEFLQKRALAIKQSS